MRGPQGGISNNPNGRPRGRKNKATIARELDAVERLRKLAVEKPRVRAKDELLDLADMTKRIVAAHYNAALVNKDTQNGAPGGKDHMPAQWSILRDWVGLYARILNDAADFQDPRYRAIAVAVVPQGNQGSRQDIEHEPRDTPERERRAANSYLSLVKG